MEDDEPTLDELIRSAYRASEGFDNWDEGKTFYPSSLVERGPRYCSLEAVTREQDEANQRLVEFIKANY